MVSIITVTSHKKGTTFTDLVATVNDTPASLHKEAQTSITKVLSLVRTSTMIISQLMVITVQKNTLSVTLIISISNEDI